MKKQLFIFMTMLLPMVANADTWDGASSETSWFNDSESTFHLTKASQLKGLSDLVNTGQTFEGKTIYLDDDIDLCNYKWEPIGSNGSFKGNFDGNKKQIKNLYLANNRDSDFGKGLGLFGRADNAYIANLSIQGKIDCYRASVAGGVAGYALNCSISNIICNVDVESVKGENVFYGGTLGLVVGSGTGTRMAEIYSDGKITIESPSMSHGLVGGIAGMVTSISESCSKAQINITHSSGGSGILYVGGIAGEVFSYVENAIFTGSIAVNNNGGDYCLTRGICVSDNEIRNVISAPSNFYSYASPSQTALIDTNSKISNSYYTTTFANSSEKGTAITEDNLKSGAPLEDFDTKIWKFKKWEYPSLKVFSNESEDVMDGRITYWNGVDSDTSWFNDESTVFHLYNAAQLKGLADIVNSGISDFKDKVICLECNIDLCNYPWVPIGYGYFQPIFFCGIFDGNGHTIKNLFISTSKLTGTFFATGFFGMTEGSEFLNLNIEGKIIHDNTQKGIGDYLGGLVGKAANGKIENVRSKIDIIFSQTEPWGVSLPLGTWMGFVAGQASTINKVYSGGSMTFTNCGVNSSSIGGIAGRTSTIEECCSNVKMTIGNGHSYGNTPCFGGIAGELVGTMANVKNAIFTGSLSVYRYNGGDKCFAGGIFGIAHSDQGVQLEEVISAPSSFSSGIQYSYLIGNDVAFVQNVYYADTYAGTLDEYGVKVTEEYLRSGTALEGFDTKIWEFTQGKLPQLISLRPVVSSTLSYVVDGETYKEYLLKEGDIITPEPAPTKEGYTFSGWSEIPETMPAHDVTVTGSFSVNKYQVTYIIDGEVFSTESVEYGATIVPPTVEDKEGYTFSGWADVPETMPAHDITIYGNFTSGIAEISIDNAAGTIIYTINGKRISRLQRGVNIVRTSDGKVKKVIVK